MRINSLVILGILLVFSANVWILLNLSYTSQDPKEFQMPSRSSSLFEGPLEYSYIRSLQWGIYQEDLKLRESFNGVINNPAYCKRVKAFREEHPVKLNSKGFPVDRAIFTTFPDFYFIKKILYDENDVVLADIGQRENPYLLNPVNLPENILIFYTMIPYFHEKLEIGKGFACEGQRYNHIPGNLYMDSKIQNALDFREYSKHYRGREKCFDLNEIYPYTLVLENVYECAEFMKDLSAHLEEPTIRWIYKKAEETNQGAGISIVTQEMARKLLNEYRSDETCQEHRKYIAQRYIDDAILINNRKFDMRAYLFIASLDPLIVLFHKGVIKISVNEFDLNSTDESRHITNVAKIKEFMKGDQMTKDEQNKMLVKYVWHFEAFEEYMISTGLVQPN